MDVFTNAFEGLFDFDSLNSQTEKIKQFFENLRTELIGFFEYLTELTDSLN